VIRMYRNWRQQTTLSIAHRHFCQFTLFSAACSMRIGQHKPGTPSIACRFPTVARADKVGGTLLHLAPRRWWRGVLSLVTSVVSQPEFAA
jgi:hypothetical protein